MIKLINKKTILIIFFLSCMVGSVYAHVTLEYPNGGETFKPGEFIKIRWNVNIDHYIENWDIWYSTTGDQGPWIDIAVDFPKGDTTQFSVHEMLWVIPNEPTDDFRIRIQQDNPGKDWDYISLEANIIENEDCCYVTRGNMMSSDQGSASVTDVVFMVDWFFKSSPPAYCSIESNVDGSSDGVTDISDLIYLIEYVFNNGSTPAQCP